MAQDQQIDRLRRLRAARQEGATRLEPAQSQQPAGVAPGWPAAYTAPPARHGHGGALVALLIMVIVAGGVIGGVSYVLNQFHSAVGGTRHTVQFVVKPGESVGAIADDLKRKNLVNNSLLFQLYYRVNGGANAIQAGKHTLNTTMSMDQIAHALQVTPPAPVVAPRFQCCTFLAGKRVEEIAHLLAVNGVASYDDVMYQVRHGTFDEKKYWFLKGRPSGATLEGFLYPDTYSFTKHENARKVVESMLSDFGRHFTVAMHAQAARAHRSVFEIVTIASIVQRESSLSRVQRYIAGVYYNRLTNLDVVDMRLEADPTVQYALGYRAKAKTWWEPSLTQEMINNTDSPYNTYKVQGLPPGPIASPGGSAIAAALNPARSPYLFFQVLSKDHKVAHTYFCRTLECQQQGAGVRVQ